MTRFDSVPDRSARELWSTPYGGSRGPTRWLHVKTTPKRVMVKINERTSYTDHFARDHALPDGAVGAKSGFRDGLIVLFEDLATCLRFMAQRARERADRLEAEVARLRADADRWDAEAHASDSARSDENRQS